MIYSVGDKVKLSEDGVDHVISSLRYADMSVPDNLTEMVGTVVDVFAFITVEFDALPRIEDNDWLFWHYELIPYEGGDA